MSLNIKERVKTYLEADSHSILGDIYSDDYEIFEGETLSEAWIHARPYDCEKFSDVRFKRLVDSANGKWLERTTPSEKIKIILSQDEDISEDISLSRVCHELQHAFDYEKAAFSIPFEERMPGSRYYYFWSEFRAVYTQIRCRFFLNYINNPNFSAHNFLFELFGQWACDSVEGILRSNFDEDPVDILYYLSRYTGATRAIRNLNMEFEIGASCLHLWTMMPHLISENFGPHLFYMASDLESKSICKLDEPMDDEFIESLWIPANNLNVG